MVQPMLNICAPGADEPVAGEVARGHTGYAAFSFSGPTAQGLPSKYDGSSRPKSFRIVGATSTIQVFR